MESRLKNLGKIVVLGAGGYMGNFYVDSLFKLGFHQSQILATDINPEHLGAIRDRYPNLGLVTGNNEKAFAQKPDAAIVAVSSPQHKEVIIKCFEAGVAKVFVEKPLVYRPVDLVELEDHDLDKLYVSYLINFSPVVSDFFAQINNQNLIVLQARSLWGKNWCAVNRPMGGDAEEEAVHPLALIMAAIEVSDRIYDVETHGRFSYVPYVQPHLVDEAAKLQLGFPGNLNDSSLLDCRFEVKGGRLLNAFIMSSFNLFEQVRMVEFSLAFRDGDEFPLYKAKLEFDVQGKDMLRIKSARTDKQMLYKLSSRDKLLEQLKAALAAFAGEKPDLRLVGFGQASNLVRIIDDGFRNAGR